MAVYSGNIEFATLGDTDVRDLTPEVEEHAARSRIQNGTVTVFVPGSTGSVTTIEFESGVVNDLKEAVERLAPRDLPYSHDARWGDGNGFSHIRAALLKPGLTIPLIDGRLALGTWQQVVFLDFDNRPRRRRIIIQVVGE